MDAAIAPAPVVQVRRGFDASPPAAPQAIASVQAPAAPSVADQSAAELNSRLTAERSVTRDAATGSLVYRLIDVSTGFVTVQSPTDARLRLRAYIDGVVAAASSGASEAGFEATA